MDTRKVKSETRKQIEKKQKIKKQLRTLPVDKLERSVVQFDGKTELPVWTSPVAPISSPTFNSALQCAFNKGELPFSHAFCSKDAFLQVLPSEVSLHYKEGDVTTSLQWTLRTFLDIIKYPIKRDELPMREFDKGNARYRQLALSLWGRDPIGIYQFDDAPVRSCQLDCALISGGDEWRRDISGTIVEIQVLPTEVTVQYFSSNRELVRTDQWTLQDFLKLIGYAKYHFI